VRAVNLLPRDQRPVSATGERSGSAYGLLGVLGVVLIAAVAYVFMANQVTTLRAEVASLSSQSEVAEARVAQLAPFGEFSQLKQARLEAVKQLAIGRLDWERLARELALILPKGSWLTSVTGSTNAGGATAAAAGSDPVGPTITLSGCSESQPEVAAALVRLKRLNGATSVNLKNSTREADSSAKGSKGEGPVGTEGCGNGFGFEATVELEPTPGSGDVAPEGAKEVPTSLGGGS